MRMKVQGRLMQARFIEIHQVFAKKRQATLKEYHQGVLFHTVDGTTVDPEAQGIK